MSESFVVPPRVSAAVSVAAALLTWLIVVYAVVVDVTGGPSATTVLRGFVDWLMVLVFLGFLFDPAAYLMVLFAPVLLAPLLLHTARRIDKLLRMSFHG